MAQGKKIQHWNVANDYDIQSETCWQEAPEAEGL